MSLLEAIAYGKYGWAVFPLLPLSKAPACPGGFHDAAKNETAIRALWGSRTNLNLGIATGDVSGFWVLDIDAGKGGEESLTELENKYGSLPETLTSRTGGGGKHYLYSIPKGIKIPCTISKLGKGIDTRGTGGYVAAPPSIHPNRTNYEWDNHNAGIADAPQWLIKLIIALKKDIPKIGISEQVIGDWTTEDVISMLEVVSPDERDTWINVGMALNDGGWPVTMWDTWSRNSPKYKMGEPFRIWAGFKNGGGISFGTLVHMAQENGWEPKDKPYEELDFSNVGGVDLTAFRDKIIKPVMPEVETKISVGGIIGDTLSWINSVSKRLQPELATMHTIATLGAVFGRRYALQQLNTRTNIYMVGIAESGQGKDNSRDCLPRLLRAAGLEGFSGPEDVRSGPGLLLELKQQPSFIANIDEFGMFMNAISDPKAPSYLKEISTIFTSIFGKSGTFYKGGLIASQPENRTILNEPNLCIFGTTTLISYAEAMRKSSIDSGKLNRFIVFKTPIDFPEPNNETCYSEPPESLVSRWAQFKPSAWGAAPSLVEQEKTIVLLGDQQPALIELINYQDKMQRENQMNGTGALWVRYRENVLKVAMILAIARDHKHPKLIKNDIDFGKSVVGSSIKFMMKFALENMYDGDFQKKCGDFMAAIERGIMDRSSMIRYLRLKTKELDEIERTLKEMGKIGYDEKQRPREYIYK